MRRALALLAPLLLIVGAGCGGSVEVDRPANAPGTPQVSLSEEPSASAASGDLETATAFVTALYLEQYDDLGQYVADNTSAARYVRHQLAAAEVTSNEGNAAETDPADVDITPDRATSSVSIEDRTTDPAGRYTWQDFQYNGGKIASWQVKGKPDLDSRLWHAKASSETSKGVKASLVSAYQGNNSTLTVVVEVSSKDRDISISDAFYTPKDGYRKSDASGTYSEVDEGSKTLVSFAFAKSPVGGGLKIGIADEEGFDLTSVKLKVG